MSFISRLVSDYRVQLNDLVFLVSVGLIGIENPIRQACRATIIDTKFSYGGILLIQKNMGIFDCSLWPIRQLLDFLREVRYP